MKKFIASALSIILLFTNVCILNVSCRAQETKYMHISFDDVYACLDDISDNPYNSIFENSFFAELKKLHDDYGAVFTLNCFNTSTKNSSYDISNLPDTYRDEFASCSAWLRFAFHAESDTTAYGSTSFSDNLATPAECALSYNKFTSAIMHATGSAKSIDTVTRLGFFTGTLENVNAMIDCNYGITGLLSADDTRLSYYFDTALNDYILENNDYYDGQLNLRIIRSQKRLENVGNTQAALNSLTSCNGNMIEIFTHEQDYKGSIPNRLKAYIEWAVNQGYGFGYAMDIEGELLKISAITVSNNTETYTLKVNADNATILVAVYDNHGSLTSLTKAIPYNNTASVSLNSSPDTAKVKFMLWSSVESMHPISLPVSSA